MAILVINSIFDYVTLESFIIYFEGIGGPKWITYESMETYRF